MALSELIKASRTGFSAATHHAVLDEINRAGTESLSLTECAEAYRYLQNVVYMKAEEDKGWAAIPVPSSAGILSRNIVDEARYPAEISLLHRLQERFRFSPAIDEWVSRGRRALVHDIKSSGLATRINDWKTTPLEERKKLLSDVIARQLEKFGGDEFSFIAPEIIITDDPRGPRGSSYVDGRIDIDKEVLREDDVLNALQVAFHEGVHNALSQLSYAAGNGLLEDTHPLYGDIRRRAASQFEYAYPTGTIPSLYYNDFEEQLAYSQQNEFVWDLVSNDTLRSQFRLAVHHVMNDLRRDMPKVAQLFQRFIPY